MKINLKTNENYGREKEMTKDGPAGQNQVVL